MVLPEPSTWAPGADYHSRQGWFRRALTENRQARSEGGCSTTAFGCQEVTNSIGLKLVLLPAGEFLMGAPDDEKGRQDNEIPQHPVRITQPFWLGVYEVTQEESLRLLRGQPHRRPARAVVRRPAGRVSRRGVVARTAKMLASAGAGDKTIKLWDAAMGENVRSLE